MIKRVLVIGGLGALGSRICYALGSTREFKAVAGTRKRRGTGDVYVDARQPESISKALDTERYCAVVVAAPQQDPLVQRLCAERGLPCVDVSPTSFPSIRESADSDSPILTMCGLFPGLSGLLAKDAAAELDEVQQVHVGLLQSTNASVGATGVRDMLTALTKDVATTQGVKPGFRIKRRMSFGAARSTVRRIHYDEADLLAARFPGADVAYYTGWSSRPFTSTIAALHSTGLLRRLIQSSLPITPRHRRSKPERVRLSAEVLGTAGQSTTIKQLSLEASSDYGATAAVVAAILLLIREQPDRFQGTSTLLEAIDLDSLRPLLDPEVITFC